MEKAQDDLKRLPQQIASHILDKLEYFVTSSNPLHYAWKLNDFDLGKYRFRVGAYRIVFDLHQAKELKIVAVLTIRHRKDVYR